MKRLFGPATWLFLGLWLVLMIGGRSRFFQDPGTFWHVATGNRILEKGFINSDPFTFTFPGTPWVPYQWLGECLMAILDRVGGFDLLLVVTATIIAAIFTGLGIRLLRCGLHPSMVAVLVACAVAASSGHFHVRPHLATMAGMAVLMIYITDVENGRLPLRKLVWLIPIFWLWANTHGGALGGLATIPIAVAGWTGKWLLGGASPVASWRDVGFLVLIWLGCLVACFAGPYLHHLPEIWLLIYRLESLPHIIKEHSRLDPTEWAGMSVVGFGALYCLLLLSVPVRQWTVSWLLPVVWLLLALSRVRHAALFSIIALVAIADFFPMTRIAAAMVRRGSDLYDPAARDAEAPSPREGLLPFAIPGALVLVAVLLNVVGASVPVLGRGWAQLDPRIWPVDLLPELREHEHDRPGGTRIFCEYAYGGFLIYYTPGCRVFIDDRCEVFGDDFLTRFVLTREALATGAFEHPAEPFAEWQQQYGSFDMAIVESGGGFDVALAQMPAAWEEIRRTETATLYQKRVRPQQGHAGLSLHFKSARATARLPRPAHPHASRPSDLPRAATRGVVSTAHQ